MKQHRFHGSRRRFLQGLAGAAGSASLRGTLGWLAGAGASAARAQAADYKALVCVFLHGGNDGYNVLVPRDLSHHAQYMAARRNMSIGSLSLLPLNLGGAFERQWGVHPQADGLRQLFNAGRLAFVANTGVLLQPTTKADYQAQRHLPQRLFSHNDQRDQWVATAPDGDLHEGWGGRLADLLEAGNPNPRLSMSLSIGGSNLFQTGRSTVPYVLDEHGARGFNVMEPRAGAARSALFADLIEAAAGADPFRQQEARTMTRAIDMGAQLRNALRDGAPLATAFPDGPLGKQLEMVARLISVRAALGMRRQVYFVSQSRFDTHDNQLAAHGALVGVVSSAMKAFHDATVELGVAEQVTAFTASDFGRTLTSNGDGTDHAWGNIHWVAGGAVLGRGIYGQYPNLQIDGPDDAGNGRLIPTTSVEQYGATLARWFGASESDLRTILPNLDRFPADDLGFMMA